MPDAAESSQPRPGPGVVAGSHEIPVDEPSRWWQLPEHWAFITEVPKTSVGKFDKKVLRKQFADNQLEVTTF